MKKLFDILVSLSVLVAASTIIYSFVKAHRTEHVRVTAAVGKSLGSTPGMNWSAHEETVVLVLKKGCHFCEKSMPFYQRLSSLIAARPSKVSLVAVFPDNQDEVDRIVRDHGLAIAAVGGIPLEQLGVSGTPTVLLVNRKGIVTREWVGTLPPDRETEVTSTLMRN